MLNHGLKRMEDKEEEQPGLVLSGNPYGGDVNGIALIDLSRHFSQSVELDLACTDKMFRLDKVLGASAQMQCAALEAMNT